MAGKETRTRDWCGTLNNPTEDDLKWVRDLSDKDPIEYLIAAAETGESGTPHIQLYVAWRNSKSMSATKKALGGNKGWHLERRRGTPYEASQYCLKDGNIINEVGNRPLEEQPVNQWDAMRLMVQGGATEYDVMDQFTGTYIKNTNGVKRLIEMEQKRKLNQYKPLNVIYLWGPPRAGKTRGVLETYGPEQVFRVTNYDHPWDGYDGQAVVLFEEFRSSIHLHKMLIYLDNYTCLLPARYADKVGTYTTVVIVSNVPFEEQYPSRPEGYLPFAARVPEDQRHHVTNYTITQGILKGNTTLLE